MDKKLPEFLIIPSIIIEDQDLQPLDGYVYGLVYWYTKLKLEKCIASNAAMARLLHASPSGISHSLTRLARKGYVTVVMNENNQREEIVPLVSFKTKDELEVIESKPSHKRATPLAQTNDVPSSNVQQNNNKLIRRFNNTVNGDKNLIQKLPNLSIPQEQKVYLKDEILTVLKDNHSEKFYLLVAAKVPEIVIRQALSEIKVDGAESPAKVFTYKMKRYAMVQQTV